ncbi:MULTISPECIES: diaminopimelate decarboxylase [unclassified Nitratiruptor]|uniref:diaminopimelate decarboxylase n=1 Tax=unclassified Nitratiruptor TaxID=2624044 RepID=UPI0019159942|nr:MULTISPECIES: diaminopimelate decarboxylase [unclassified Nitratiruptor]BCD59724.1 diaminopimelate decarboxylase [Nitratiruptor sp. YY08-10]BCD63648.1 diaminopimelate decarboxylase [Nitratiruptor sp. YY08-14]
MDYRALAQKYDTPLYVYDFNEIAKNYEAIKEAFKARKSIIAYAVKANSNMSLLKHLAKLGSGADCVSIGEVKRALLAGIPNYKIIFSGVGKRDDEIEEALLKDILYINIESEAETYRVEEIAKKIGKVARVSFRVNPNIDPKTHPYISTGLHENKFGVEIETAKKLYLYAKNSPFLNPVAIHFHIGSQLTELEPIKEASAIVANLVRSLQKLDIDIKFFDVGGGLGIRYKDEKTIEPYDYAQAILSTLSGTDMTIVCEPGRYIVGNAGVFLTTVLYEKQNGKKRFIIVDGAMNDLLRPSLYNAYHEVEVVGKSGDESLADVVGPVCESGDFLAKNRMLPQTEHGDIVVVKSAGAYGFVMASNYNTRPRPAEVAIENGQDRLIRERESFEYIIEKEIRFMV